METAVVSNAQLKDEEDGEILEDGEIDDDDLNGVEQEVVVQESEVVEEEIVNGIEEINDTEGEDDSKKRKKSHHRRRRKKHDAKSDDAKSEEKKSRHKKRKQGDDGSEGNDSPPSKRKKKKKKHSRDKKDRESSSPEAESRSVHRPSESPPMPSEQTAFNYGTYTAPYGNTNDYAQTYDASDPYSVPTNTYSHDSYSNDPYANAYGQDPDYSSGSDSYYSDFESHLKQYQSYKQNKDEKTNAESGNDVSEDDVDDDNYYSVGYDAEKRRKRRVAHNDSVSNKKSCYRSGSGSQNNDEKRKSGSSRRDSRNLHKDDSQNGKGDKSSYSQYGRRRRANRKIPQLCQQYCMQDYCSQLDKCNFMHEDYPCKYFHTGTVCVNGDDCKYSHEPSNDFTAKIIKQFQEAVNSVDDSKEIAALEKVGIKPLQKPPPGMGLLPTPPAEMALIPSKVNHGKKSSKHSSIPSLFDINVKPTLELQQKIDANSVASLQLLDNEELDEMTGSLAMPPPVFDHLNNPIVPGPGLLPLPSLGATPLRPPLIPNFPPPTILGASSRPPLLPNASPRIPAPILPSGSETPPWILRQQALLQQEQNEALLNQENVYNHTNEGQTRGSSLSTEANSDGHVMDANHDQQNHSVSHMTEDRYQDNAEGNKEDVIRMDDHSNHNKTQRNQAPDFLPPQQKALLMRIRQKGDLSNESSQAGRQKWDNNKSMSSDDWTYSSDEDDKTRDGKKIKEKSSGSVQSIIQMISNKKNDHTSVVDTNLLSKVANVINMSPDSAGSLSHAKRSEYLPHSQQSSSKPIISPSHHHHPVRERKSSGSSVSPAHQHPSHEQQLRRRLSTSELNKEPVTIPLVTRQSSDAVRTTHPDPRITMSRLFGKTKTEFRASLPTFGNDIMLPGSSKMVGLKITLSSSESSKNKLNGDKLFDPRLIQSQSRPRHNDPRVKNKLNDPRLRMRGASVTKTSPPHLSSVISKSSSIPPKPTALLTKPSTSIIPSLPELNLDLAPISESKPKVSLPPVSLAPSKSADPLVRLPKLFRGNVRPSTNRLASIDNKLSPPKENSPPIAPYDPRYISSVSSTAAATSTTTGKSGVPTLSSASSNPAPYDPRVINSKLSSVPPLFDPRSSNQDPKRAVQLPKLTPAPGYLVKMQETNGNSKELPTGEALDF